MNEVVRDSLKLDEQVEAGKLANLPGRFAKLLERQDVSLYLWAPQDPDTQKPHDQDEVTSFLVVAAGFGAMASASSVELEMCCSCPQMRTTASNVFSVDFRTWVFFLDRNEDEHEHETRSTRTH